MATYSPPVTVNGSLKQVYNALDFTDSSLTKTSLNNNYVKTTGGSISGSLAISGSLGLSSTGIQNITGIISGNQYADKVNLLSYSASVSLDFNNGMVYYVASPTGAITGITITNIPTVGQRSYCFTFIMNTTSQSNLITATNVTINSTVVPIYYNNNSTPSNNAFIQTLYLVNISSTSTPSFKVFSSYSNY